MKRRAQTTERHKITIMAKLADILETEQKRADATQLRIVHLFADGTFYRAYEWSAWLCCRYINSFKATKRNNKSCRARIA